MNARQPLRPDRLRSIERERPFAWLPCRLLSGDLMQMMSPSAKALYLHLALAADRLGLSFWGDQRMQQTIGLDAIELQQARQQLIDLDLLAFDGRAYQLLSLPRPDLKPLEPSRHAQPRSSVSPIAGTSGDHPQSGIPEDARCILRRILGPDFLP